MGGADDVDILAIAFLGAVTVVAAGAYLARIIVKGPARFDRVDSDGGSWIFHRRVMAAGYWAIQPIGLALARLGVRPDHITWCSVLVGLAAGYAFLEGRYGIATLAALVAGLLDALDGLVGRMTGTVSSAGTVLDSSADRYVEFFWLAGIAFSFRGDAAALAVTLLALHGSYMVSYASAKAQAAAVRAPRGVMKRPDRVLVLLAGSAASAIAGTDLPLKVALAAIAVLANYAAVARLAAVRRMLKERDREAGR